MRKGQREGNRRKEKIRRVKIKRSIKFGAIDTSDDESNEF